MTTVNIPLDAACEGCTHRKFDHAGDLAPQCEHDGCNCLEFRVPRANRRTAEQVIAAGRCSGVKRTAALADRIALMVRDLSKRINDEAQAAEVQRLAEQAATKLREEIADLETRLAEKRAKLPARKAAKVPATGDFPCQQGCSESFASKQRLGAHHRWQHPAPQSATA